METGCRSGTDFDARFEIETEANRDAFEQLQNSGALLLRYQYTNGADLKDPGSGLVDQLKAQPGTRFPHAWIEREEKRISTLDLLGSGYVHFQGPDAPEQSEQMGPLLSAFRPLGYRVETDFTFCDSGVNWFTLTDRTDSESVLVRPDGFVLPG